MTALSAEAADVLLHMTGRRPDSPEPGRNRWVGPSTPALTELVGAGLVEGLGVWRIAGEHAWRATAAGLAEAKRIAAERAPRRSRSQRRYDAWLEYADMCDFRSFLTHPYWADVRRAAERGAR